MLEVGINTYCTLADADALIAQNYPLGDYPAYWSALSEQQKENLLIKSAKEIENLPVAGVKAIYNQPLQFPRKSNFFKENAITDEVKDAQAVNALKMMLISLGIEQKDGNILSSLLAETKLKRWTSGGYKMGGLQTW